MKERICKNCEYRKYETDMKEHVCVCDDPDGEYFGQMVREREHCPDWKAREDDDQDRHGNA